MRHVLLFIAVGGCALARQQTIHDAATALDAACSNTKYDVEEVEPWVWRVNCSKDVVVWCRDSDGAMRCGRTRPETERTRREQQMRTFIECPAGDLKISRVDFDNRNKIADSYRWGELEVEGCGRLGWWGNKGDGDRMLDPPDLDLARNQLAVETGCTEPARQLQRFGTRVLGTYRLEACGHTFVCSVPLYADERSATAVPASVSGNQATCKPALDVSPAAPAQP